MKVIDSEAEMMTIEKRALLVDVDDQLIELYVEHGEAKVADEFGRGCKLQIEINKLEGQRNELRSLEKST